MKGRFAVCIGLASGCALTLGVQQVVSRLQSDASNAKDCPPSDPSTEERGTPQVPCTICHLPHSQVPGFDYTEHAPLKYGIPTSMTVHAPQTGGFVALVDHRLRLPVWVAEHITPSSIHSVPSKVNRKHSRFYAEPAIPAQFRAALEDYRRSGYSRGHLSPASNNKRSQIAMDASFSLANVVPQEMSMNGCDWLRLERMVQQLVTSPIPSKSEAQTSKAAPRDRRPWSDVYVFSGPLFLAPGSPFANTIPESSPSQKVELQVPSEASARGRGVVSYRTIGAHSVAVPTHMYKIVLAEDTNDPSRQRALAAFVMPNGPIKERRPLSAYQVPLRAAEAAAGLQFFPLLHGQSSYHDLCAIPGGHCKYGDNGRTVQWRRLGAVKAAATPAGANAALAEAEIKGFQAPWMASMFRREHRSRLQALGANPPAESSKLSERTVPRNSTAAAGQHKTSPEGQPQLPVETHPSALISKL